MSTGFFLFMAGFGITLVTIVIAYNYYFRVYFRAQMAECPVSLPRIVGFTLQGLSARAIVDAYVSAHKEGLGLELDQLVLHTKAGGNVRRVVTTLIEAKKLGGGITFEQACKDDLAGHGVISFPGEAHKTTSTSGARRQ